MDFFSSDKKEESHQTGKDGKKQHSVSDLFSDAKVLAGSFNEGKDKMDKAKAATAAADLLDGAQQYGKLEETQGVGKYIEKAEDYLEKYGSSTTTTTTTKTPTTTEATTTTQSTTFESSDGKSSGESDENGGGGFGGYLKKAQDFMK